MLLPLHHDASLMPEQRTSWNPANRACNDNSNRTSAVLTVNSSACKHAACNSWPGWRWQIVIDNILPNCRDMEALHYDIIWEICNRLPIRNRFVLRDVSSFLERLVLQYVKRLELHAYGDTGASAAIDVLELLKQSGSRDSLLHLSIIASDPEILFDCARCGPLWRPELEDLEYIASHAGPSSKDGESLTTHLSLSALLPATKTTLN